MKWNLLLFVLISQPCFAQLIFKPEVLADWFNPPLNESELEMFLFPNEQTPNHMKELKFKGGQVFRGIRCNQIVKVFVSVGGDGFRIMPNYPADKVDSFCEFNGLKYDKEIVFSKDMKPKKAMLSDWTGISKDQLGESASGRWVYFNIQADEIARKVLSKFGLSEKRFFNLYDQQPRKPDDPFKVIFPEPFMLKGLSFSSGTVVYFEYGNVASISLPANKELEVFGVPCAGSIPNSIRYKSFPSEFDRCTLSKDYDYAPGINIPKGTLFVSADYRITEDGKRIAEPWVLENLGRDVKLLGRQFKKGECARLLNGKFVKGIPESRGYRAGLSCPPGDE